MSVQVRVPTVLRTYTGGAKEVSADGSTVGEVFDALDTAHPGIKDRVVDEQGQLRRFVNVYVDNEDVRFSDGLATPVADGTQVSIIPSVAGGC
jgi:sulfur-carrier protein